MEIKEVAYLAGGWLLLTAFGVLCGGAIVAGVESLVARACPPCNCPAPPNCDVYSEPPHLPGYIYTN